MNDSAEVLFIVERVKPLLAGHAPEIQGAVLAELLALWLAGHHQDGPLLIDQLLTLQIEAIRKLVPGNVEILKRRRQ